MRLLLRQIQNSFLPLLLVFAAQKICAQLAPPGDFFNRGAQFYISNNIPAAKEQVQMGLKMYPDDEKLKKLEELLKQQQQSQNSQSQQNQQQNQSQQQQSKDNQQSQQQKNRQQNSQEQPKPDSQAPSGQKRDEQQKQVEQPKSSAEKKNGEKKPEDKNADGQPVAAGQMTPQEAKRLLDAQKGNEQFLQLKPQNKPQNQNRPIKDW